MTEKPPHDPPPAGSEANAPPAAEAPADGAGDRPPPAAAPLGSGEAPSPAGSEASAPPAAEAPADGAGDTPPPAAAPLGSGEAPSPAGSEASAPSAGSEASAPPAAEAPADGAGDTPPPAAAPLGSGEAPSPAGSEASAPSAGSEANTPPAAEAPADGAGDTPPPAATPLGSGETLYEAVVPHLVELRSRLLRAVSVTAVITIALLPWANDIYTLAAFPWLKTLGEGGSLIATQVTSPVLVPIKTALALALALSAPYILYQAWAFVAPGLYKKERRLIGPLSLASAALFYLGAAFAFFAVFPLVFRFLNFVNPTGVAIMTDISNYLNFILGASIAFGFAFQAPVVVVGLVLSGITTPQRLAHLRPYVIVGAFVAGMLLTPPDVVSQILLAVPVWLLYEAGLAVARRLP